MTAAVTTSPDIYAKLARQSLARPLSADEVRLADALEEIFKQQIHDFDAVAKALTISSVTAPKAQTTQWTRDLLAQELAQINASLDEAYGRDGLGA